MIGMAQSPSMTKSSQSERHRRPYRETDMGAERHRWLGAFWVFIKFHGQQRPIFVQIKNNSHE